nr:ribonuclease H-like domain-containing protein [Tanacetum cinerariifolium]
MDDLYNNLKVYEAEIKGQSSSSSNSQNMAFVSSDNTGSTNEAVNTANDVTIASSHGQAPSSTYADDVMFFFFANQSNSPQLDNEDLEQIDIDDLEEIDLKWQVAMLTMRIKVECYNCHRRGHFARECRVPKYQGNRNGDNTRKESRVVPVETPANSLVVQDGIGGYDWNYQAEEGPTDFALMAHSSSSSSSNTEVQNCSKECLDSYQNLQIQYDKQREIFNKANLEIMAYQLGLESLEARIVVHQKNEAVFEENVAFFKYDVQESDSDDECVIKPSKEQNKSSCAKINLIKTCENTRKFVLEQHLYRQAENLRKSQNSRNDKNGMMTQKLGDDFEFKKKACYVCGSINHLIKDCNFYENKMVGKSVFNNEGKATGQREVRPVWNNVQRVNHKNLTNNLTHPHPKRNFVSTVVVTKSGQVPVNAAKQSSLEAATSISIARLVNIAVFKPNMNGEKRSLIFFQKSHSLLMRPINKRKAVTNINNVATVGPNAVVSTAKGKRGNGNPQYALQDQGIFDSGCFRHMTGNKSFLTDYQEIVSEFVAFGESPKWGKITGKGKIRTEKLDFEDVYFVKELKFNLFSVSQMCDKKNSVLFTETECFVLSLDFKLLDENQVLLKVPRQNNMYSFDLKNVVLSGAKNETSKILKSFITEIENLVDKKVKNRVLVVKPHFKTPYELFRSRTPALSFMRPFGCHVTILNTLDHLEKFDGKSNEGFFVGYSTNSKAFRVYNTRTRKVKENLHINFLENKPIIAGGGPEWIFEIDALTELMNYVPVIAGTNSNDFAGKRASFDAVIKTAGPSINTANANDNTGSLNISTVSPPVNTTTPHNDDFPTNPLMPDLESAGIFGGAYDDREVGAEADTNNLEPSTVISPIPTTIVHKDHPKE